MPKLDLLLPLTYLICYVFYTFTYIEEEIKKLENEVIKLSKENCDGNFKQTKRLEHRKKDAIK